MTKITQNPEISSPIRWTDWLRPANLGRRVAMVVATLSVAAGIATYATLTGSVLTPDPTTVRTLLLIDLVLLLSLGAIVGGRLAVVWMERRRGLAGSRLHIRMVTLFSIVAVAPAIVVAAFAVLFFDVGLQGWFSKRVQTAVSASVAVAEAYIAEHRQTIRADALAMAIDINRAVRGVQGNRRRFDGLVTTQARLRALSEAAVFDSAGQLLSQSSLSFVMGIERPPKLAMERARDGDVVLLTGSSADRVRALVRLDAFADAFLFVGRFVEPRVIAHLQGARRARDEYEQLQKQRFSIEVTVALIFAVVTILLLLAAVWLGLGIATQLARKIGGIVQAAERVRDGDLTVRVPPGSDDDLGTLARTFNRMTNQLQSQRSELLQANLQLEERRRFMETVLSGVTAGVIGLDDQGRIELPNRSAMRLLDATRESLVGNRLPDAVPEFAALFEEAAMRPTRIARGQVDIVREGGGRNLMVRIAVEKDGGEILGYVVTFDNMTDLVSAQRTAAWADVARRIAHEIKNPLTPIQLSAERLKRKYLREVTSDPDVFTQCTDTIVRQVAEIGRMVDEFSSFARMPAPIFKAEDFGELVRQAVFMQQIAGAEITYNLSIAGDLPPVSCDRRQISRVLTNILKNATEAVVARLHTDEGGDGAESAAAPGLIDTQVGVSGEQVEIVVTDNGIGLPATDRHRLTEPYVTTRTKGTGLGLAIVNKVMEEHRGELILADGPDGGAVVRLILPLGSGQLDAETGERGETLMSERVVSHGT